MAYLSGADEIYSMGLLGSAQVLSLDKMVVDNFLAHQIECMVNGFSTDEEHLAFELIARVGVGGQYLNQRDTRDFTQREYIPKWPPEGESMLEVAHAQAQDILASYKAPALPAGAADKIDAIIKEAQKTLHG
jgi:trimethylamine--corrinoid protein Co-methyltransferase